MSYKDPDKRRAVNAASMRKRRQALRQASPARPRLSIEDIENRIASIKSTPCLPAPLPEPERVEAPVPEEVERQIAAALAAGKHPRRLASVGDQWLKQARKVNAKAVKNSGLRNRTIRERDLAAIEGREVSYEERAHGLLSTEIVHERL